MSLNRKILDRIEKENIRITPKWYFATKNTILGTGTLFAIITGSIILALIFEVIYIQGRNLSWLNIPYVLVILMIFSISLGYWTIRKIDYLYRLKFLSTLSILFFVSLAFGYLAYSSGEVGKIEGKLKKNSVFAKIMSIEKEPYIYDKEKFNYWHSEEKKRSEEKKDSGKRGIGDSHHHHDYEDLLENHKKDKSEKYKYRDNNREKRKSEDNESDNCDEISDKSAIEKKDENTDDLIKGEVRGVSKEIIDKTEENEDDEEDKSGKVEEEEKNNSDDNDDLQKEDVFEDNELESMDLD